jgi:hypothetical protein
MFRTETAGNEARPDIRVITDRLYVHNIITNVLLVLLSVRLCDVGKQNYLLVGIQKLTN